MRIVFILVLVICFNPIVSIAKESSRWVKVAAGYYVDKTSVQYRGDKVEFWSKEYLYGKSKKRNYYSVVSYEKLNCSKREQNIFSSVFYDKNGHVMKSYDNSYEWIKIVPESKGEAVFEYMCVTYREAAPEPPPKEDSP